MIGDETQGERKSYAEMFGLSNQSIFCLIFLSYNLRSEFKM
jgi:hypothetical protein